MHAHFEEVNGREILDALLGPERAMEVSIRKENSNERQVHAHLVKAGGGKLLE